MEDVYVPVFDAQLWSQQVIEHQVCGISDDIACLARVNPWRDKYFG
ncbi:hypothetical protein Lepto7375DRAFT_4430 [Leptolyngbya sp. PCC 7375]|nr:hypothetical protein Lepto7375DRAFT_4430 [Leptolyngbya sp. PCC 7375]